MHDDLMRSYVETMSAVGKSEASRTMLAQTVERERHEHASEGHMMARPRKCRTRNQNRRALRIAAAAACAGVLAIGGAWQSPA